MEINGNISLQGQNTVGYVMGGSTTSLGRASASSVTLNEPRMRSTSQESQQMQMEMDDGTRSNMMQGGYKQNGNGQGSGQRKRSRLLDEASSFVKEGLSNKDSHGRKTNIDATLQLLNNQIEQVFMRGERGKTIINKTAIQDTVGALGLDIFQLLAAVINLQEEKTALQYQVIQLQAQGLNGTIGSAETLGSSVTQTYLQAAMLKRKATNIATGKNLPVPEIPQSLRHAPAERVLIFKAAPEIKGTQITKQQHEEFREDVHNIVGEDLMEGIDVIRPTRNGGHTIIFQNEQARGKVLEIFRKNEKNAQVEEERSCIIAPKKKCAKVVCREPPDNTTMDNVLHDFYGKNNMHLYQVPRAYREARIINTRFGWIFDISSMEAAAIQAQGGRIRYGNARELKVEEYIPLQQCYNCCAFGHNAKNCRAEVSHCRLCGKKGHAGWDCLEKDNRENWRCANCQMNNEIKGMHLPTNHAAAQLHKCPCALNHKEIRKLQLSAAGVFTTPIVHENLASEKMTGPVNDKAQWQASGSQHPMRSSTTTANVGKKNRSRSIKRDQRSNMATTFSTSSSTSSTSSTSASSSSSSYPRYSGSAGYDNTQRRQQHGELVRNDQNEKAMKVQRPRSYDGWKTVGRPREREGNGVSRGRELEPYREGTNSTSSLPMVETSEIDNGHMVDMAR